MNCRASGLLEHSNRRLQELMHRNSEGKLTANERQDLAALAALSEYLAVVRAGALRLLGRESSRD